MRVVAVTRIYNEDDIVEAFVKHNSHFADHHIFLDNGSVDRTPEILEHLKAEGYEITCFRQRCCFFNQIYQNTFLYNAAARYFDADWVLFLDTDEFIDGRESRLSLKERLGRVPEHVDCLKLPMVNYHDSHLDDATELIAPLRIRWRWPDPHDVFKICLRASLRDRMVTIDAGNHDALLGHGPVPAEIERHILLAHYVRRSPWQDIAKSLIGRLKVLAAGRDAENRLRSVHYVPIFEALKQRPEDILLSDDFLGSLNGGGAHLVDDPIEYLGQPLRYTTQADAKMKSIKSIVHYVEEMAAHHGELLDRSALLKVDVNTSQAVVERIF